MIQSQMSDMNNNTENLFFEEFELMAKAPLKEERLRRDPYRQ